MRIRIYINKSNNFFTDYDPKSSFRICFIANFTATPKALLCFRWVEGALALPVGARALLLREVLKKVSY